MLAKVKELLVGAAESARGVGEMDLQDPVAHPPGLARQPGDLRVQLRAGDLLVAGEVAPPRAEDDREAGGALACASSSRPARSSSVRMP
ncbi:MAG: hypothetical protein ABSA02_07540 [Trebonia sp.]